MYPVNLINLGINLRVGGTFLLVFLFSGRDHYDLALIYVYKSFYGKKRSNCYKRV